MKFNARIDNQPTSVSVSDELYLCFVSAVGDIDEADQEIRDFLKSLSKPKTRPGKMLGRFMASYVEAELRARKRSTQ